MSIIKNYRLRLDAGNITPLIIHVNQYDKNEIWNFTLIDYQGNQYITTEAAIVGKKPDGCLIVNNCTVSEGIVSVEVTEQMTAAAGRAVFELLVDGQMHGTANFVVLIERSPEDGAIESESDLSLFQQAIDATSTPAIIAGVQAWMDENLTPTSPVVDSSLSISGAAADAKKTGDEISELKSQISSSQGMSAEFKVALENLLEEVAYTTANGRTLLYNLHTAMYPPVNLSRITAVYEQGTTVVYDTDTLDSLKANLVVTAYYDDGTNEVVTGYTLIGVLEEGTSTVTVEYGGKSATFNVEVSKGWTLTWDYTAGGLPHVVAPNDWEKKETGNPHTVSFETGKGIKWVGSNGGYTWIPKNYQTTANGEIEIVVNFESFSTVAGVRATLSDTSCLIGFLTQAGVRINGQANTPISDTALSANTEYTLRVVREGATGKVYLNDTLVYNGEVRELSGTNNVMISTSGSGTTFTVYIKSIKFRHLS